MPPPPDPKPHDATKIGPLGVQLHLPATITPDPAAHPAVGGPTTKPITDIGNADQPMNIDTVQTEDAS